MMACDPLFEQPMIDYDEVLGLSKAEVEMSANLNCSIHGLVDKNEFTNDSESIFRWDTNYMNENKLGMDILVLAGKAATAVLFSDRYFAIFTSTINKIHGDEKPGGLIVRTAEDKNRLRALLQKKFVVTVMLDNLDKGNSRVLAGDTLRVIEIHPNYLLRASDYASDCLFAIHPADHVPVRERARLMAALLAKCLEHEVSKLLHVMVRAKYFLHPDGTIKRNAEGQMRPAPAAEAVPFFRTNNFGHMIDAQCQHGMLCVHPARNVQQQTIPLAACGLSVYVHALQVSMRVPLPPNYFCPGTYKVAARDHIDLFPSVTEAVQQGTNSLTDAWTNKQPAMEQSLYRSERPSGFVLPTIGQFTKPKKSVFDLSSPKSRSPGVQGEEVRTAAAAGGNV